MSRCSNRSNTFQELKMLTVDCACVGTYMCALLGLFDFVSKTIQFNPPTTCECTKSYNNEFTFELEGKNGAYIHTHRHIHIQNKEA